MRQAALGLPQDAGLGVVVALPRQLPGRTVPQPHEDPPHRVRHILIQLALPSPPRQGFSTDSGYSFRVLTRNVFRFRVLTHKVSFQGLDLRCRISFQGFDLGHQRVRPPPQKEKQQSRS